MTPNENLDNSSAVTPGAALAGAVKQVGLTLQNTIAFSASIAFPILSGVLGWPQSIAWAVSLSVILWLYIGNALSLTTRRRPLWVLGFGLTAVLLISGVSYWASHQAPAPSLPPSASPTQVAAPNVTFGEKSPAVSGTGNKIVYGTEVVPLPKDGQE